MSRARIIAVVSSATVAVALLAGCGSSTPGSVSSSSATAKPDCTEASLKTAISPDDSIQNWACAHIDGGDVAAVRVTVSNGDNHTFWFKSGATQWYPADGSALCAGSGLPQNLQNFCPQAPSPTKSPSASPTATHASICNEGSITAIVQQIDGPQAKVDSFECAKGSITEYAAVKVTNGGLIKTYFLEDEGGQWVLVSDKVCSGDVFKSDPKMEAYCKK